MSVLRTSSLVSLVLSLVLLSPSTARAGERPIMAVFDIENRGPDLPRAVLDNMSTYLTTLVAECSYQVLPRDEIRARIRNQKIASYKQCYDQKCQIELGRELAAQKTLATKILKIGDRCQLTSMLYDLKKAATEKAASVAATCDEKALLAAVKQLADKICIPMAEMSGEDSGGVGILLIKTVPTGARVKLDGKDAGVSPVTLRSLDSGRHVVEAEKGALKGKQSVQVRGGAVARLILPLAAGKLVRVTLFSDPPEARAAWDGKDLGNTPVVIGRVRPGKHKLKLSLAGYLPLEKEVQVSEAREVNLRLFSAGRKVRLVTVPPGGEIFIGKKSLGRAPLEVVLPAGEKQAVKAGKENYLENEFEVPVVPAFPGAPPQVTKLELIPKPVSVQVAITQSGARVTLGSGDLRAERSGSGEIEVTPGKRKLVVVLDGYKTIEKEMDIPVGQSSRIDLQLEPLPAYSAYKERLVSKRWQAWGTLALGVLAAGGSAGLLVWAADSQHSADDAYADYRQALDKATGQAALDDARSLDKQAQWGRVGGYTSIGVAALALGWSIYSFATTPERRQTWNLSPAPAAAGNGGQFVLGGQF